MLPSVVLKKPRRGIFVRASNLHLGVFCLLFLAALGNLTWKVRIPASQGSLTNAKPFPGTPLPPTRGWEATGSSSSSKVVITCLHFQSTEDWCSLRAKADHLALLWATSFDTFLMGFAAEDADAVLNCLCIKQHSFGPSFAYQHLHLCHMIISTAKLLQARQTEFQTSDDHQGGPCNYRAYLGACSIFSHASPTLGTYVMHVSERQ